MGGNSGVPVGRLEGLHAEEILDPDEGEELAAQVHDLLPGDLLDVAERETGCLLDGRQGDGELAAAATNDERLGDGERERELDAELGPHAQLGLDFDPSVDLGDIGVHDVHADATAGELAHLTARREARQEDEVDRLRIGELLGGGRAQESPADGLRAQKLRVDPAAVVLDLEDDRVPLVAGPKNGRAGRFLAPADPLLPRLDSVRDGVADEVHEGVGDHLEDRLVDLRFAAGDDDGDGLPSGLGQVPDGPREPEEEPVELDHAGRP